MDGLPADIGRRAFDVLLALVERRDRLVTKQELLDVAWPGVVVEENNLQVQISTLRKILGDGLIVTVAGRGYRFNAAVTSSGPSETIWDDARAHGLPRSLTRFIGHESELPQYEDIVEKERLVTLTGAGGVGKTRVVVELARRVASKFEEGAWFVDLAPMADPSRVPLTVAMALGLSEHAGQPIVATLCEHLSSREILLVLDNCEHLLTACAALVKDLLARAPRLTVLATSREGLGVPGEQTLTIRSLSCPPNGEGRSAAYFEGFEAVRLFQNSARLVQPTFTLDEDTAPVVGEICRRVDGIPLAIELAAARMRVLSAEELRQRLDDRFRLLVGVSSSVLPRHHTLRAALKWSVDLLTPQERRLLQRLSVFAGGWTLEAAVAVADDADEYEVLDLLAHLVDKSLIVAKPAKGGPTRYTMLETVRQYATEELAEVGETQSTVQRHLEYFVEVAERLGPAFFGSEQKQALQQLAPELENIVQAMERWIRGASDSDLGLRLVTALRRYFTVLGLLKLSYRLTSEALGKFKPDNPSSSRAYGLLLGTMNACILGHVDQAQIWAEECLVLARGLSDDRIKCRALAVFAQVLEQRGDRAAAIQYAEESLSIARECKDSDGQGRALLVLGTAYRNTRKLETSRHYYEEGLRVAREKDSSDVVAVLDCNVSAIYIERGDVDAAWPLIAEAIALCPAAKLPMRFALESIVALAVARQHWRCAAQMLGASETLAKELGVQQTMQDAPFTAALVTAIKGSQSEHDFQSAYEAGRAMTLEEAVQEARDWLAEHAPNGQ